MKLNWLKLLVVIIVIELVVIGCGAPAHTLQSESQLPHRLEIVSQPLQVSSYRHYVQVIKDRNTGQEFIVVTKGGQAAAICPFPVRNVEQE